MFKEKIQPSLVLTLICLITCALLVMAYEATYTDSSGVITDKIKSGLTEVYGSADGFEMMKNENGAVYAPEGVTSVLSDAGGNTAFEITTDGYSSGGLHVLVGLDNMGAVKGVSILTIGETPGLGTRVQNESFLGQFAGLTYGSLPQTDTKKDDSPKKYVWWDGDPVLMYDLVMLNSSSGGSGFELDAVTGATFSSKGMNRAVTIALTAYENMKGAEE